MIVVRISKVTRMIGGAFVRLAFKVGAGPKERQVIVPSMHAPGMGELAVFVSNRENRPFWMKSPLLVFHGRGEAMGQANDGGLYACKDFDGEGDTDVRFALMKPRMFDSLAMQDWATEGQDVTAFYLGIQV